MASSKTIERPSLASFLDELQSRGRYTFTRDEAAAGGWRSDATFQAAVRRLKEKERVVTPRRGFHVLVPLEYRTAGAPPASWFIDGLMSYLGQRYYVGLLSAAAIHGAAHQQPMAFQVVTDRPTKPAHAGRVRIQFHMRRDFESAETKPVQTETGTMRVATPEMTAFDLVRFARAAGHWSNVATVLAELSEKLDPAALRSLAEHAGVSDVQRLGYLLDFVDARQRSAPLRSWLESQRLRPVRLQAERPKGRAQADASWRVIPNVRIEPDR